MERISAACAMEWSIELDMALRSKKRGRAVEAILQLGQRIQQWSKEPEPTMAVYKMFGLIPGEDSLFANTILLRLADAFRLGDVNTRAAVVKVFLMELRSRRKEKRSEPYRGILWKPRVHNQMELLERVKIVFDTGDAESRALVLVLFGCWADFAKDSAHVRYLILSSMVSSDILEVKASLFAAGCFCELACDFASVAMEMIFNIVASSEILRTVRLAAVRVFAKMGSFHDIANRAYETGLKLVSESSDDEVLAAMLVSLSTLACRSTLILSNQVDLLFSFLCQENTPRLQATALRCIKFIFVRQACNFPVHMHIRTLFTAIKSTILPSNMQFEASRILCKMVLHRLVSLPSDNTTDFSELLSVVDNMLEFVHLLTTVENAADSLVRSKGILALHTLVNVLLNVKGRGETGGSGDVFHPLSARIISTILNYLFFLVKLLLEVGQADAKIFKEVQSLLSLLLFLVGECSELGILVLDTARLLVKHLAELCNQVMDPGQACLVQNEKVAVSSEKQIDIVLKLVYDVHHFSVFCIETLSETSALSEEIIGKLQLLIECVHQCSYFDCYAYLMYSMLLHSHIIWGLVNKSKLASNLDRLLDNSLYNLLVESEIRSLEYVKKMPKKDNWLAYKTGSFAACQGAWVTAAFIFEQLLNKVEHKSSVCWLNSLALFSQSESKIQLLLLPTLQSGLVELLQKKEFYIVAFRNDVHVDGSNIHESNHTLVLAEACHGLHCSQLALESIIEAGKLFYFQRWFLALRVKVLGIVVDMLNILDTIYHGEGTIGNNGLGAKNLKVDCANSVQKLTELSSMLRRVAEGFDLLAMSCIGMDGRSLKTISAIALSCSVLAFAAGFAPFFLNLLTGEISICSLKQSDVQLQTMLTQDLVGRLWLIDQETCTNLCLLLGIGKQPKDYFHFQSRNCIRICGNEIRNILHICKDAVSSILGLQNKAKKMKKEEALALSRVSIDGLQILSNTITKWMHVPFRIPRYFFKVRPCVVSELFAFSGDARNQNELSVSPGFHLSLHLCLKLQNLPPDFQIRLKSTHCILCTSMSFHEQRSNGETKESLQLDYLAWEDHDIAQMNEKLLRYVTRRTKRTRSSKHGRREGSDNEDHIACAFASFELNDMGQGFSNCLLDVSNFPVGSYRIKWHSCCIDSEGSYWSLLPLKAEFVFNVQKLSVVV